ncbi:MAG: hypothetical protein NTV92_00505 [Candidatus Bipolaricaulota bacterium]|nr:hypothetical protein [Candidatus Bipolaricaulota bacterium]
MDKVPAVIGESIGRFYRGYLPVAARHRRRPFGDGSPWRELLAVYIGRL